VNEPEVALLTVLVFAPLEVIDALPQTDQT
jgi:hypothetical protein